MNKLSALKMMFLSSLVMGAVAFSGCDDRPFVTAVDLPLQVISLTPADGSVNVARDAELRALFNLELVEASAVDAANVFLDDMTDPAAPQRIDATLTYSSGEGDVAPQVLLAPSALLAYSTPYRVTLTTGIKRAADEAQNIPEGTLLETVTASFRTVDPPPLALVSSAPGNGAQGVALDQSITITFSEPVSCASLSGGVVVTEQFDPHPHTAGTDQVVSGTWTCSDPASIEDLACIGGACTVVFTPDSDFSYSSHVIVSLQGGNRDDGAIESFRATATGGQLSDDLTVEFDVEDPADLSFVSSVPSAGSEQIAVASMIQVTFSEPLECDSVNADTVQVQQTLDSLRGGSTDVVTGTLDCQTGDDFLTFTPDNDFDWSALIEVSIAGGSYLAATYPNDAVESFRATSKRGQLPASHSIDFIALDPAALQVISTNPQSGSEGASLDGDITLVFSEDIDCGSVEAAISDTTLHLTELADDGRSIEHSLSLSSCIDNSIVLNPDPNYSYSGLVTLTLPETLHSTRATTRGGWLTGGFAMSFRAMDPPALMVMSTSPQSGTEGASLDGDITLVFSEDIDCGSVEAAISDTTLHLTELADDGRSIEHSLSLSSCIDNSIVLNPDPNYSYSGLVTLTLPETLHSTRATTRGGWLTGGFAMSFRAMDPPALMVTSTIPGAGATTSNLDTMLTVVFSEAIDCTTVDAAQVLVSEVLDDGSLLDHTVSVSDCSGDSVIFDPALGFALSSAIVVTLPETISSVRATSRSGTLEGGFTWAFETADPPDLLVLRTSPGDGNIHVQADAQIVVTFSDSVELASVSPSTFVVEDITDSNNTINLSAACADASSGQAAGSPCSYVASSVNVSNDTITFTPPADFDFDHRIRFTLTTGIASSLATSGGGNLGADLSFAFEIIPVPPIDVVSLDPPAGAVSIPRRPVIRVEFNQDVLGSTLVVDPSVPAQTTVWLTPGSVANSDPGTWIPLTCTGCGSTGTQFSFIPDVDLTPAAHYTFVIRGDYDGIRGASSGSFMVSDYLAAYTVTTGTIVAIASPAQGATDVPVTDSVCVIFTDDISPTTVHADSFAVHMLNTLGTETPIVADTVNAAPDGFVLDGVNPATGEADSAYSSNRVCFIPGPATYGCQKIDELLPANAAIQVVLSTELETLGGERLSSEFVIDFTTGGLQRLVDAQSRNIFGQVKTLADAQEVPVNADMKLHFSGPIDVTTAAAAVTLRRLNDNSVVNLDPMTTLDLAQTLILNPTDLLPYLADLPEGLALEVQGGVSGLRFVDGNYLEANYRLVFATSPATQVWFSLGDNNTPDSFYQLALITAVFDRPMYLPSINSASFYSYYTVSGVPVPAPGIVATNVDDVDSAVFYPTPSYETFTINDASIDSVSVSLTTAAQDYLGNPLQAVATVDYLNILPTSSAASLPPDDLNISNVQPSNNALVTGDQVFVLSFPDVGKLENRMLPSSINSANVLIDEQTCPDGSERGILPSANTFNAGVGPTYLDAVKFWATQRLHSGCTYHVTLMQNTFANVYTVSNGKNDVEFDVVAEQQAPSLLSVTPADNAADVSPASAITVVFDEAMLASSFDPTSTFTVNDGSADIAGQIQVEGDTAVFIPSSPLQAGLTYTVTLGAVSDMADNLFAGASSSFTVESQGPSLVTVEANAQGQLILTFDEALAVASVEPDTVSTPGSVQVRLDADGSVIYGCLGLDDSGAVVTFYPVLPLSSGAAYTVTVTSAVTDLGGAASTGASLGVTAL